MGSEWETRPQPDLISWLGWCWRRQRARRYVRAAEWALVRNPSAVAVDACERARRHLARVELNRP